MLMKSFKMILGTTAVVVLSVGKSLADIPTMKMTTEIPEGIPIADKLETSIGTLKFFDGVPDRPSAEKIYDNLDLSRAVQTYLNTVHIASMQAMRKGILEFGPANYTVLSFETMMDSKTLFLTPNTSSIYNFMWLDLKDGPIVAETPPGVLGIVDNAWFGYLADFGNAGPDKGKGGKYLFLPPGYKGEIPEDGYIVKPAQTYGHWFFWRGFLQDGDPAPAVENTRKTFKMYPLGKKDTAPEVKFINVSGNPLNTIGAMDFGFWEDLNTTIQYEPLEGLDPEIAGQIAALGIEKGKPFEPDERMKKILSQAADIGHATARTLASRPRDSASLYYPGESYWSTPFLGGYLNIDENGARILDARTRFFFYATGVSPAMNEAPVGTGSQYAMLYLDKDGNPLDGSKTYKVHLPPDVPAKDFWSFVVYDNQTRSMLQTDQQFPSVSSAKGKAKQNPDGSYDIYFGPKAPDGMEDNWVQTISGKGWNMLFRLYGPLQPWFDKTWRPSDAELVE